MLQYLPLHIVLRFTHMQWLRAQQPPAPWDASVCLAAAIGGHLETLMWLWAVDAPWCAGTSAAALNSGKKDVQAWVKATRAP
jgi:hypothetical protein